MARVRREGRTLFLPAGPGFYDVGVPGNLSYFVRAFLDANNDFLPNPDEPRGVYSPSNQGCNWSA